MFLVSSCSCLWPIYWGQLLSRDWRCSWSSTDRPCSNHIWVINHFIAYSGSFYIRRFTVFLVESLLSAPEKWNFKLFTFIVHASAFYVQVATTLVYNWICSFLRGNNSYHLIIKIISHYRDFIMSAMASQITGVLIVCSTVCSVADQRKYQSPAPLASVRGNPPMTGRFPSERASNVENASIWWRHHV